MKNKEQIAKIWDVLDSLNVDVLHNKQAIIKLENEREQNSLIERKELTGSDLCRAMLARGDKYVMCLASDDSQADTLLDDCGAAISSITDNGCFYGYDFTWLYVTPINNQGEPLTQSDVGL